MSTAGSRGFRFALVWGAVQVLSAQVLQARAQPAQAQPAQAQSAQARPAQARPAQAADEVLKRVDRYRYPWPSFSMEVTLQDSKVEQQWRVQVRENGDARVEGLSAKEQGRVVLLLKEQMWLLLPNAKRPVKVSPQQRLLGPAAGADVARFRFSGDYTLTEEREEALDGRPARRLELAATRKGLSYPKAVLWLTGEDQPLQSEFFYASGKLARTARFGAIVAERGVQVLSGLELEEPNGRKVKLAFAHWKPASLEDRLFQLPE